VTLDLGPRARSATDWLTDWHCRSERRALWEACRVTAPRTAQCLQPIIKINCMLMWCISASVFKAALSCTFTHQNSVWVSLLRHTSTCPAQSAVTSLSAQQAWQCSSAHCNVGSEKAWGCRPVSSCCTESFVARCMIMWVYELYRTGRRLNVLGAVVTICTTSLTFTNPMVCPHSVFTCFVLMSTNSGNFNIHR